MAAKKTYSTIGAVFIGVFVLNIAAQASTAVFSTFTTTDYSNNASQTSGIFRDFLNNSSINRGTITTGTFNTSGLTFAGVTGGPTADWTLYDTSPSLAPADLLTTKHVTESLERVTPVYNIEVDGFHTFFVTEESILVHNKG